MLTKTAILIEWLQNFELIFKIALLGRKAQKVFIAYSTVGIQLALFLVLFTYGGYRLDVKMGTSPLFVLVGGAIGLAAGLYNLIKGLKEIDRYVKNSGESKENRRKWL